MGSALREESRAGQHESSIRPHGMEICRNHDAAAVVCLTQPALAQTVLKFSLDWKYEGTQAPFLVALDKGYFKAEGLDVTIDTGASALESINRLAAETYDMAFADINLLIKFRDQNPEFRVKTVFMTYNKPAYAIVSR